MNFNSVIKVAKAVGSVVIYGATVGFTMYEFEKRGVNKVIDKIGEKDEWFINYLKRDRDDYRTKWLEANGVLFNLAEELRKNGVDPHNLDFYSEYVGYEDDSQE